MVKNSKLKVKARSSEREPVVVDPPPGRGNKWLLELGILIEAGRRAKKLNQKDFATEIEGRLGLMKSNLHASQTLVARLEKGRVQDPRPEVLRAISDVLGRGYEYETLIGRLMAEKYGLAVEKVSPLLRRPLTLEELAVWERSEENDELWIVSKTYVDQQEPVFEESVRLILRRKGAVIFFLPETIGPRFERYKRSLLASLEDEVDESQIRMEPLASAQEAIIAAGFVIANPRNFKDKTRVSPTGYLIMHDELDDPYLAIEMYPREVLTILKNLEDYNRKLFRYPKHDTIVAT